MDIAEKVAKLISDKRDEVAEKTLITNTFPTQKKMLVAQLNGYFDSFYDQVSVYVNDGDYFNREVIKEKNDSVYLYGEKLIYLSFEETSEEENTYYKAIITANDPQLGDMEYELKIRYFDGKFSWYNRDKVLTSDTFDEFMDEAIFGFPF